MIIGAQMRKNDLNFMYPSALKVPVQEASTLCTPCKPA